MLVFILLLPTFTIPILLPNILSIPQHTLHASFHWQARRWRTTSRAPLLLLVVTAACYHCSCSLPATAACRRRFSYHTHQLDPIINKLKIKRKRRGYMKFDRQKDKMRSILPLWQHKRGPFLKSIIPTKNLKYNTKNSDSSVTNFCINISYID